MNKSLRKALWMNRYSISWYYLLASVLWTIFKIYDLIINVLHNHFIINYRVMTYLFWGWVWCFIEGVMGAGKQEKLKTINDSITKTNYVIVRVGTQTKTTATIFCLVFSFLSWFLVFTLSCYCYFSLHITISSLSTKISKQQ